MDDMAEEFGEMLRVILIFDNLWITILNIKLIIFWNYFKIQISMFQETLEKMRERIEVTSGNFESPDVPIQKRMEEMKLSISEE